MKKYHLTKTPFDGDVAKDRDRFIGGSDVGTILGLNPWKSAYTLWLEKTGQVEVEDISEQMAVWLGHENEATVAKRFTLETGKKVKNSNISYGIKEYPFLRGHIDRLVVGEKALLECKTTSSYNKTEYDNGDIPPMHYCQVQFYQLVTGFDHAYYAVIRDNREFFTMRVDRNDEFIEETMLPALIEFWQRVETKTPPTIDGSISTKNSLDQTHVSLHDDPISLGNKDALIGRLEETKAMMKKLDTEKTEIENQLKESMQGYDTATTNHYYLTYRPYVTKAIDRKRLQAEFPEAYKACVQEREAMRFGYRFMKETMKEKEEG